MYLRCYPIAPLSLFGGSYDFLSAFSAPATGCPSLLGIRVLLWGACCFWVSQVGGSRLLSVSKPIAAYSTSLGSKAYIYPFILMSLKRLAKIKDIIRYGRTNSVKLGYSDIFQVNRSWGPLWSPGYPKPLPNIQTANGQIDEHVWKVDLFFFPSCANCESSHNASVPT